MPFLLFKLFIINSYYFNKFFIKKKYLYYSLVLSTTGPPIWNVLTSFDLDVICAGLKALGTSFKLPLKVFIINFCLIKKIGQIFLY